MSDLRYEAPDSVEAAVGLLTSNDGAKVMAGGTDLLVQLREEMVEPELIIDIKRIAETRRIEIGADEVRIGAAMTGAELGEHEELVAMWPGVVEAVELIGSWQVQGRATIGGNLCNASPAADSVPAIIASGAKVAIAGPNGAREIPAEEFPTAPGRTALESNEFVTSLILPVPPKRSGDAYLRFIPRTEMDIAVVGAGVSLSLADDGTCASARLSLGAVAPKALLVEPATEVLVGNKLDDDTLSKLDAVARDACSPIDDKRGTIEYRTKVAGVLARRSAAIAWQRAEKNNG
ncbi:MAG TPA: oxidoreductase [Rhodospirillaceae bacterium]|nr:oxidoreductase [Rhodospirillaceae bacterium]HAA93067.1 oxidoreductase [Rhodospirillaceae bacterium]HAT34095.1 oxidoreductase [Rhodospirillaceae bacterium]